MLNHGLLIVDQNSSLSHSAVWRPTTYSQSKM